jgi:hypothetical protein
MIFLPNMRITRDRPMSVPQSRPGHSAPAQRIIPRIEELETRSLLASGIQNIQHVIIIMQENRSFDEYFGTYPGADGIPNGVCVPDPRDGRCVAPYHDTNDRNSGASHFNASALADYDNGAMDGFLQVYRSLHPNGPPQGKGTQLFFKSGVEKMSEKRAASPFPFSFPL